MGSGYETDRAFVVASGIETEDWVAASGIETEDWVAASGIETKAEWWSAEGRNVDYDTEYLVKMWENNRTIVESKRVQQLIAFAGNGDIENKETCQQLREYFQAINSELLFRYIEECLHDNFEKKGFVLQELINEIGRRLGFAVTYGRFRGRAGENGMDGSWVIEDPLNPYTIIVESKTSDNFRVSLETLQGYRRQLIQGEKTTAENSSILIVVGRNDTGELEAQIRGSRFAWDIRLISVEALITLLKLKETFNDSKTIHQIYEVLKPREYTKVDRLIELIFATAQDAELDDIKPEEETDEIVSAIETQLGSVGEVTNVCEPGNACIQDSEQQTDLTRTPPARFHDKCVEQINRCFSVRLQKKFRTLYATDDGSMGVVVSVSKRHSASSREHYWFAYHPYFLTNLAGYKKKFIAYGCGSESALFLLPIEVIEDNKNKMWITEGERQRYWHVNIYHEADGRYYLQLPYPEVRMMELSQYQVKLPNEPATIFDHES